MHHTWWISLEITPRLWNMLARFAQCLAQTAPYERCALPGSTMDNRNYNASAILNQWTLPCSRFKRQNRVDLSGLAHSGLGSGSFRQLKVCSITVLPSPAELACWTLSP